MIAFGMPLPARSFVQDQVSTYSCEAEYHSHSSAVKDVEYVNNLLNDLLLFPDDDSPPSILVDRDPTMVISQGSTNCWRTKHIDFTMALVRDYIQLGLAVMEICPTADQIADMCESLISCS